jgi:anti-anti-sigma factor
MKITSTRHEAYALIGAEGSLSMDHRLIFEDELEKFADGSLNMIIDLGRVTFIDSSSLGLIILFYTNLKKINKQLVLANVNNELYQMFSITGVAQRIKMFDSLNEAIEFVTGNA